eukprot:GHVO01004425.1.p1 GENE.GHVO01004425.1~~GHVO01004425.1.p1  ORF type:complete len:488 (+),score=55.66 GHVO01004425.1:54-1517(+)
MSKPAKTRLPYGTTYRATLMAVIFVILSLTGMILAAADSVQQLMLGAGRLDHLPHEERMLALKKISAFGYTWNALAGLPVGAIFGLLGPKLTGMLGMGLQTTGMGLMFFTQSDICMRLGGMAIGHAFQAARASHLCITELFPGHEGVALSSIGASMCISMYVPFALVKLQHLVGGAQNIALCYMGVLCVCFVCEALVLPWTRYCQIDEAIDDEETTALLNPLPPETKRDSKISAISVAQSFAVGGTKYEASVHSAMMDPCKTPPYKGLSLREQILTPHYLCYLPLFIFSYFRCKLYPQNVRDMMIEHFGGTPNEFHVEWIIDVYNTALPMSCMTMMIFGFFCDLVGVRWVVFFHAVLGLTWNILVAIPWPPIMYIVAIMFVTNSSFLFSQNFAFIVELFGVQSAPVMQGMLSTCGGLFSLSVDEHYNQIFIDRICSRSYATSSYYLSAIGAVLMIPALYILLVRPKVFQVKQAPKDGNGECITGAAF